MSYLIKPHNYNPILDLQQTERGIKQLKDFFQENLASALRLRRVTAPLFVMQGMGINDDLNGVERAVNFPIKDMGDQRAEIVHSLAKWKRLTLADYQIQKGFGIYTDMNAIRADEELGNLHSLYVDQWDWELVIGEENKNLHYLKRIVKRIYAAILRTEFLVYEAFPMIKPTLAPDVTFIQAEDLLQMYPNLTAKERENEAAKKYKENGCKGLNGDLIVWNPILNCALELSSMGIRVDSTTLKNQLELRNEEQRSNLYFHKRLLNNELPLSIGGGIGQSRLCMFLLHKAHIGEIQAGLWPRDMISEAAKYGMTII